MALNPLAHIGMTGVIHTLKAKHKMASFYTISHITWQLERDPRVQLLIHHCCPPQSPNLSFTVGETGPNM